VNHVGGIHLQHVREFHLLDGDVEIVHRIDARDAGGRNAVAANERKRVGLGNASALVDGAAAKIIGKASDAAPGAARRRSRA
jgi:hypothetical protein